MTIAALRSRRTHRAASSPFRSLRDPNYAKFAGGQLLSMMGSWMQVVGQGWLVLVITGSATWVGVAFALQTVPQLLLSAYGGVIADRFPKVRTLVYAHAFKGVFVLGLGVVTLAGVVELWMVLVVAACLGLGSAIEFPVRSIFVEEMVGPSLLVNAVSLNAVIGNCARIVGPALAGGLVLWAGVGWCFIANAVSFIVVIGAMLSIDASLLHPSELSPRSPGQLRAGLRYVMSDAQLRTTMAISVTVGCLTMETPVTLPVLATDVFNADAGSFALMLAAMGVGAVLGGVRVAGRGSTDTRAVLNAALWMGLWSIAVGLAPGVELAIVGCGLLGWAQLKFIALANTNLQLVSEPGMRGRVIGLWFAGAAGTPAIGGPVMGWIMDAMGGRFGLIIGGGAGAAAALEALRRDRRRTRRRRRSELAAPPRGVELHARPSASAATCSR